MSYDISIKKSGVITQNNEEAWLSVTTNYASLFCNAFQTEEGIKSLNNMTVQDVIPVLKSAIDNLSDDNTPPSAEELRAEAEEIYKKNAKLRQILHETGDYSLHIFCDINDSYAEHIEKRLRNIDHRTGRPFPSGWDATPYNAKKALHNILALAEQSPIDAIVCVEY